eukprot:9433354-Pyramimonas_sp.AAC.1
MPPLHSLRAGLVHKRKTSIIKLITLPSPQLRSRFGSPFPWTSTRTEKSLSWLRAMLTIYQPCPDGPCSLQFLLGSGRGGGCAMFGMTWAKCSAQKV